MSYDHFPEFPGTSYDRWKTTDDTPEPEPDWYCETCEHYGTAREACGCPCCTEPQED